MLIFGIDPGSRHTGFAVIEMIGPDLKLVDEGRVSLTGREPLASRLAILGRELDALLLRWQPTAAGVEAPFHGMNARSLIVLAQARGAILQTLGSREVEVHEYSPAEIKMAVAGNGRAAKQDVARMVELLLKLDRGTRPDDQTDAIAIAICLARRYKMDSLRKAYQDR